MSEISKQALLVDNSQSFPNNNAGAITPANLRAFNVNMIDSLVDEIGYNVDSASWNNSISNLNTFTSSQQPTFTALNSFTASQIITNNALNLFTQSANQELDSLSAWTGSWEAWTSSINEIRDDGVLQGYSTRFYFNGLVSASIVTNVDGPIANVTIQQDGTKLNTSSFNDYTASTAATQSVFSASVATSISASSNTFNQFSQSQNSFNQSATASIVELLNLSSSLSGGYATQGELDQSSSVLQANIDTKLNTSSFNSYTQSLSQSLASQFTTQSLLNGTFATTGSNTFIGNQSIIGTLSISSSTQNDVVVNGQMFISSSATANATQPRLTVSGSAGSSIINRNSIRTSNTTDTAALFPSAILTTDSATADEIGITVDPTAFAVTGWSTGPAIYVNNTVGDTYPAVFGFQNKANYTDGRVTVLTPLVITGSVTITGSVLGNINSLSITSNTASMNLALGNFFTLELVSGSTTRLETTNITKGQTINLLISQPALGTGSVTYPTTFKFPTGGNYVATPISGTKDILTFITFDSSTIYATSINNLS